MDPSEKQQTNKQINKRKQTLKTVQIVLMEIIMQLVYRQR